MGRGEDAADEGEPAQGSLDAPRRSPSDHSRKAQPVDAAVGRRIRHFRLRAGLTQKALAQQIGVSFQQLQKYEEAVNRASASRVSAIARCLGVPVEAFFTPDHDSAQPQPNPDQASALLQAFSAIPDPDHRRAVLALARTLARRPGFDG